jgi:hypothetical protein
MTEGAICLAEPTQRRRSSTRRWDIDQAILNLLKSSPKTASKLRTEIRVGIKHHTSETAPIWKTYPMQIQIHGRSLAKHLGYLQRDGLIACESCLKVLHHDRGAVYWLTKYYTLQSLQPTPTPLPTRCSPHLNPQRSPKQPENIHKP